MPRMTRPTYGAAIDWVANNDEPTCEDLEEVEGMITVRLLADLFEVEPARIAFDVVRLRGRLKVVREVMES